MTQEEMDYFRREGARIWKEELRRQRHEKEEWERVTKGKKVFIVLNEDDYS